MNGKFSQKEAEQRIKSLDNGDYELVGKYKGSNEFHTFKHLKCGKQYDRRWSNFIDAFRQGSPHYKCPYCKN